ncbi:MAG TPA: choice-of-anchor tandem repeat GloVer-containing protein [Terriglobales bacterium]
MRIWRGLTTLLFVVALTMMQISLTFALLSLLSMPANASPTLSFLRLFTGAQGEGANALLGFTAADGTVFGVTADGGQYGSGTVFTLSPPAQSGAQWTETILYNFTGGADGKTPVSLTMDRQGVVYGTAIAGGSTNEGVVFKLAPDGHGGWVQSVVYNFTGEYDGGYPLFGVTSDAAGNLYGATYFGGDRACDAGCGVVFRLSPNGSGWRQTTLHVFHKDSAGYTPAGALTLHDGKLYGSTMFSDQGWGVVFELGTAHRKYSVIYTFQGGRNNFVWSNPVIFDSVGNIYSTTVGGGAPRCRCGEVYELSPPTGGQTTWTKSQLYAFTDRADGKGLFDAPIFGTDGNLYGVTVAGGTKNGCWGNGGCGTIYRLSQQNGQWTKSTVYAVGSHYIYPRGLIRGPQGALLGRVTNHIQPGGVAIFALHGY